MAVFCLNWILDTLFCPLINNISFHASWPAKRKEKYCMFECLVVTFYISI